MRLYKQNEINGREGRMYEKDRGNINSSSSLVRDNRCTGVCSRLLRKRRRCDRSPVACCRRTGYPGGHPRNGSERYNAGTGICCAAGASVFGTRNILRTEAMLQTESILCARPTPESVLSSQILQCPQVLSGIRLVRWPAQEQAASNFSACLACLPAPQNGTVRDLLKRGRKVSPVHWTLLVKN